MTKYGRIKVELTIDFKEYISESERDNIIKAIPEMVKQIYNPNLESNILSISVKDVNHLSGLNIREGMGCYFVSTQTMGGYSEEVAVPKNNF